MILTQVIDPFRIGFALLAAGLVQAVWWLYQSDKAYLRQQGCETDGYETKTAAAVCAQPAAPRVAASSEQSPERSMIGFSPPPPP